MLRHKQNNNNSNKQLASSTSTLAFVAALCLSLVVCLCCATTSSDTTKANQHDKTTYSEHNYDATTTQPPSIPPKPTSSAFYDKVRAEHSISGSLNRSAILNCAAAFGGSQLTTERPFVVTWLRHLPTQLDRQQQQQQHHLRPIYLWYFGYKPRVSAEFEGRVTRIGQASLSLGKLRHSDSGFYECKVHFLDIRDASSSDTDATGASSVARQHNSTLLYLDVQAAPVITKSPPAISFALAGDTLRLECQAESTPAPVLRWFRGNTQLLGASAPGDLQANVAADSSEPLDSVSSLYKLDEVDTNSSSSRRLDLIVESVEVGVTSGEYQCVASNAEGSTRAQSFVQLAVAPVITRRPQPNVTLLVGERLELSCKAMAIPSNISYTWLLNDKPLGGQHSRWRASDASLVVNSVQQSDAGHYKCRAASKLNSASGKHSVAEASSYVSVEFAAQVSYSPPVQYLPLAMAGVIRCHVLATPPVAFITWTLNNNIFEPATDANIEPLTNGSLLVRQVSRRYEGAYRCTPFNKHGSAGSSATMQVRVEEPPKFVRKPREFYKSTLAASVQLECEASGLPQPTVMWRRQLDASSTDESDIVTQLAGASGELGAASELFPRLQLNSSYLTLATTSGDAIENGAAAASSAPVTADLKLNSLTKEHHGRYECVVENQVATLVTTTMLFVDGKCSSWLIL